MNTEETALVVAEPVQTQAVSLFGGTEPLQVIAKAEAVATALRDVIRKQGLVSNIQGKEYPRCEAWTLLGTMIGVYPVLVWSKPVADGGGWEARVEARTRDGAVVGAAEAECLRSEGNWSKREDFALRSMAQTRATAKALRMPLGFVMTLAGYEATPAEEMTFEPAKPAPNAPRTKPEASKPVPAPKAPPEATEEQKQRFLSKLRPVAEHASKYAIAKGWILDTEDLADIPLSKVPATVKAFEAVMADIQSMMDDQLPGAEAEPDTSEFELNPPDEPWRNLVCPFGKNKGERFGDLDKKSLWWWIMVWKPEPREFKGKVYEPSEADLTLYDEIQKVKPELVARYKFKEPTE